MTLNRDIAELCLKEVPKEACGVVVKGQAILCENTSEQPEVSFLLSPHDFLKYRPDTIFHSHPTGSEGFSDHDLAVAANMELTSYVYVVEADRLERWRAGEGLKIFEGVLQEQ